jgi:ADP-ribosyl-[dinitrogen reductase] hydrolase
MSDLASPGSGHGAEPLPLPNSYWVIPGKLLAGEHPAGTTREETQQRIQQLLDAGIRCFIDLTMPEEMAQYDMDLPMSVEYIRKPIKDHAVPARREHMLDIQACLEYALRARQPTYVHCRAGIGRTGTVMGCFLVERGMPGADAMEELNRLWRQCQRAAAWPNIPETEEQIKFVLTWTPQVSTLLKRRAAPQPQQPEVPAEDPLFESSTLSAARNLRDRFLGALVGLAVGDALAAATQFKKAGTFAPVGDMLGGGPFDLPRGAWSDDTSMALCLADSLAETERFDPKDQVQRYTRWQQQGYLSSTGQCVGITAGTAKALAQAKWRRQLYSGSHDPTQLDPEVLSRIAPVIMFFFASPTDAVTNASESARTTCQSPAAVEACRLFGAVLYGAIAGQPKSAVLTPGADLLDVSALRTEVAELARHALHLGAAGKPRAGNVVDVLESVLWAFRTTDNFRDGVLRVANLGANSDVAAATFGQLAGAYYGVGSIPGTWRNSLIEKDLIEGYADRLLAHAMVSLGN